MSTIGNPVHTGQSRVFLIEDRAGPGNVAEYQGPARVASLEQDFGEPDRIEQPDPNRYGKFIEVGEVPTEVSRPTTSLESLYEFGLSDLLRMAKKGCQFDVQIHLGDCEDPSDFINGWRKIIIMEKARFTSASTSDLGALASGDGEQITQEGDISAREFYEVIRINFSEKAGALVNSPIVALVVCDTEACGDCDNPSDGCSKVFAVAQPISGSAGINPEVIFTEDGYTTSGNTDITTMGASTNPDDAACVGPNLIVIDGTDDSLHYAPTADILNGDETWIEVGSGFVAAGSPRAITSVSPRHTWIVGDGGYIYFTATPPTGVSVQDAGLITTQNLNDVYAINTERVIAVGASNAVVYTIDGGTNWVSVTGPAVGTALQAVNWQPGGSANGIWWVGDANGSLWYSKDLGTTWTENTNLPTPRVGDINVIEFATDSVGYIGRQNASTAGQILRTIDGGHEWYVLPEDAGAIPENDDVAVLAVCPDNPNVVFGGGTAGDAADGFLVKGSGA